MKSTDFIAHVVREFYRRATVDVLIGYHFRHINDFSTHLPRINAFWEMQLLGKTTIPLTQPLDAIMAHVPLRIHTGEVGRWVKLFQETLLAERAQDADGITERWQEKVLHFQQIFLRSPLLFPKA